MAKKQMLRFLVPDKKGGLKWKDSPSIRRFPRSPIGKLKRHLASTYVARVESGDLPRGYDRLDKKWKKIARAYASGEHSAPDICRKFHVDLNTFYRRRRAHPLFVSYLKKCIARRASNIPTMMSQQDVRAVKLVGDALDSPDIYFRTDVAQKHLKGRGHYSTKHEVKTDHTGHVQVDGNIERVGLDKDMIGMFVNAIVGLSQGRPAHTIETTAEEVKLLPEKTA